jgi:short chain dehydrogenase
MTMTVSETVSCHHMHEPQRDTQDRLSHECLQIYCAFSSEEGCCRNHIDLRTASPFVMTCSSTIMRRTYCTTWKWDRKGSTFVPTINRGGNVVLTSTLMCHITDTDTDTSCRYVHRCHSSTTTTTTTSHPPFLRDLFSLEGRCAIVTGGGTGIGLSLAAGLARAGACVMLTARRQKVLEQAKAEIQKQLQDDGLDDVERRVHVYPSDITDFPQINPLVQEAEYVTGIPPTILVNNAGANLRKPIDEVHSEDFASSQALMITAPFLLTRALAPNSRRNTGGS